MKKIYIGLVILALIAGLIVSQISFQPTAAFLTNKENPITITAVLPLTGANSLYGEAQQKGLDLAISEVNANGGINGKKIELIYEDNQSDPKTAVTSMQKALNRKSILYLSSMTPTTMPILPVMKDTNNILMIVGSIHNGMAPQSKYFFKNHGEITQWANILLTTAAQKGCEKIAIVSFQTDQGDLFVKEVQKTTNPVLIERFDSKETNMQTIALKINESYAECVLFAGFPKNDYSILKSLEENNILIPTYLINAKWPEVTLNGVGNKIQPYVAWFPFDSNIQDKKIQDFRNKFENIYSEEPTIESAIVYDDLILFSKIANECKEEKVCIINEMARVNNYPGIGGTISFDENRNNSIQPIIMQYKNNGWEEQ